MTNRKGGKGISPGPMEHKAVRLSDTIIEFILLNKINRATYNKALEFVENRNVFSRKKKFVNPVEIDEKSMMLEEELANEEKAILFEEAPASCAWKPPQTVKKDNMKYMRLDQLEDSCES